ncbi:hypothetical protein L3X38_010077 [Prunus dulcis]|uniref:Uncharacterized protein n=1 Tax=Prunus dulcis TaxID=3755 RepID=A0AAD4ZCY9_PRUDU|nr:hypothetical protein L3X38_010077 [Prunus dulcis]
MHVHVQYEYCLRPKLEVNLGGRSVESSAGREGCRPSARRDPGEENEEEAIIKLRAPVWYLPKALRCLSQQVWDAWQLIHWRKVSLIVKKIRSLVPKVSQKCTTFDR